MELSFQIRPKLFQDISGYIAADLKAEFGSGLTCGAVVGGVGIRDSNCNGVVRHRGVSRGSGRPRFGALTPAPGAAAEVTRVLVKERWEYRAEVFAEAAAIPAKTNVPRSRESSEAILNFSAGGACWRVYVQALLDSLSRRPKP